MAQFKRKRIKTGPNSWINITQHQNGTTTRSVSNKAGNTTTNISSKGVRKTQNNNGWVQKNFWSYKPKKPRKSKSSSSSSFKWLWSSTPTKKSKPMTFDPNKFAEAADRFEKSKANMENWSKEEVWTFIIIVTIIIVIIQLAMR